MNKLARKQVELLLMVVKQVWCKRVDIDIDTPNIMLKINIRNKQGGVLLPYNV